MSADDEFEDEDLAPYLTQHKARVRNDTSEPDNSAAAARSNLAARVAPTQPSAPPPAPPTHYIESIIVSETGRAFVVGWADDRDDSLQGIGVLLGSGHVASLGSQLTRFRRRDVESALGFEGKWNFGYFGFITGGDQFRPKNTAACLVTFASGAEAHHRQPAKVVSDVVLLQMVLGYFNGIDVYGNKDVESFRLLENHLGIRLIQQNHEICQGIVASASCERFGPAKRKFRASIIVCLYGKAEYFFVQNALFTHGSDLSDYEFIFVSNSPELAEILRREAKIAERIYGLSVTLVTLSGNAGFGGANNVAAGFAKSDRLLLVNPDVFPVRKDWAAQHREVLDTAPRETTRLFGAPLFYADGSLMHSGMHYESDSGISIDGNEVRRRPMLRVEHYGKGAPPDFPEFRKARQVPAVSGAFISIDRELYERLGGFSEEYIFGHYEDADLCLRAYAGGTATWLHDVPMWHLEGKGSHRLPHHEGASMVNRWLFTRTWNERLIAEKLLGTSPSLSFGAPIGDHKKSEGAVRPVGKSRKLTPKAGSARHV